jgi:hypothetical protein
VKRSSFVLALALVATPLFHYLTADEIPNLFNSGGGFTDDPQAIKEIERLVAQQRRSMRQITIREANLFHKRFIEICMRELPRTVTIHYVGLLGTDNGRKKVRIHTDANDVGGSLDWHVQADLVIFDMWISTMRTKETVAKCEIEKKDIFVNVLFVDGKRGLDDELAELGGSSVRKILSLLEGRSVKEKPPAKDTVPKRD